MDGKKWIELYEKRKTLLGTKIILKVKSLAISQAIFKNNYNDLLNLMNYYETNDDIWLKKNRFLLSKTHFQFLRLLHNYLASACTLIDHARVFKSDINNSEFNIFYNSKLNDLKENKITIFFPDLRNYFLHYALPDSITEFSFNNDILSGQVTAKIITLNKIDLISHYKWKKDSIAYMGALLDNFDIKPIIKEYFNLINNFYISLYSKLDSLYFNEIKELLKLEQEMQTLIPKNEE